MGKKAKRLKGEEVYEVLCRLSASEGASTTTGAVWDEVVSNWPEGEVFPGQQAVYLHLVRLQKAGKATSRRVGQHGGGQQAVWELAPATVVIAPAQDEDFAP